MLAFFYGILGNGTQGLELPPGLRLPNTCGGSPNSKLKYPRMHPHLAKAGAHSM